MSITQWNKLWNQVETTVESKLEEKASFGALLKGSKIANIDGSVIFVVVREVFAITYANHLINYYKDAIQNIFNSPYEVKFITEKDLQNMKRQSAIEMSALNGPRSLENQSYEDTKLNKNFTLSNYVVDTFNASVVAGLKNIVSFEEYINSSVFIYGKTGRGKSHLLNAIGNYVYERSLHKRIKCITAEDFGKLVQEGFQKKISPVTYVIEQLSNYDIFLLDDIQSVASWGKTIEAFFHLYNYFINSNKLIIVVSDESPLNMKTLPDRMVSRFTGGLVLELLEANVESTVKIIEMILMKNNAQDLLNESAKRWLAEEYKGDIRSLKGAITKLIYFSNLNSENKIFDEQECAQLLGKKITRTGAKLTPALIKEIVSTNFNISVDMLVSSSRNKLINIPRQLCMYLMKEKFNLTYSKIGSEFGGKDHSTVINALKKTEERMRLDKSFKHNVEKIRAQL